MLNWESLVSELMMQQVNHQDTCCNQNSESELIINFNQQMEDNGI